MASLFAASGGSYDIFEPLTNDATSGSAIKLIEHPATSSKSETTLLREISRGQSKAGRRRVAERMKQNGYTEYRSRKDLRKRLDKEYSSYEDPYREAVHQYNQAHRQALLSLGYDVPEASPLSPPSGHAKVRYQIIREVLPCPRPSPGSMLEEFLMTEKNLPLANRGQLKLPNIVPPHRWGN
jgi:hypothetical protein